MKQFRVKPIVSIVLSCMLIACAAGAGAQSTHLDKHARKVHHKLAKYRPGNYLHLILRNDSEAYGALGELSDASFTFTNADSNSATTFAYDDIDKIKTDKEAIGQGMEPRRHIRHLVPILITVAAAGTAAVVVQAER